MELYNSIYEAPIISYYAAFCALWGLNQIKTSNLMSRHFLTRLA